MANHIQPVLREVHALPDEHALSQARRPSLLVGALLHDVGKVQQDAVGHWRVGTPR